LQKGEILEVVEPDLFVAFIADGLQGEGRGEEGEGVTVKRNPVEKRQAQGPSFKRNLIGGTGIRSLLTRRPGD